MSINPHCQSCCTATNNSIDPADKDHTRGHDKIIKNKEAVKTSSATRARIEKQGAECYYGGRINYNLESTTGDVD